MSGPRVLYFDLETSPILCWTWGLFKQNIGIPQIVRDSHLLTWAAKWAGEDAVMYDSLPAHDLYKKEPFNDIHIVESMWHLLNEADIVIAQNGDKFDVPKINAAFFKHDLTPPSTYRTVDTLKIARGALRLTSNKLDWMARFVGEAGKIKTDFDLWTGCINGEKKAWDNMVKYNIKDVTILEDVYTKLAPWSKAHPNHALYTDDNEMVCTTCGSNKLVRQGHAYTSLGKFQQYQCKIKLFLNNQMRL